MQSNEAVAQFLLQVARAAEQLAGELMPRDQRSPDPTVLAKLGSRQAEALDILAKANRPLRTREITRLMNYDFSNCWMTLRRLEQLGLVEQVAGAKPQAWRVAPA